MLSFPKNYLIQGLLFVGFVLYTSLDLMSISVRRSLGFSLFTVILLAAIGFSSKDVFQKVRRIHLKIAFTLIIVAYIPIMRSLGGIFAYDSLIIAFLYITGIWIMAIAVNDRTRYFLIAQFHFLVYILLAWTALQSTIQIRSSDILYTFGQFVRLPFQINYGLVSKSQNHFSLLIAGLMAFVAIKIKAKATRIMLLAVVGFMLLLVDSFFALVSLAIVVSMNQRLIKNHRTFLALVFIFPFVFLAISEIVAGNLGITNQRIVTLNNRSHIWGGLMHYMTQMDVLDWIFGNGYFGNFNDQTKAHYTQVFGKGFTGARTSHSTVIQLVLDAGIIGCLLVYQLLRYFYQSINNDYEKAIGAMVSVLLLGGFLESIFQMYDPLLFGVLLFAILLVIGKPAVADQTTAENNETETQATEAGT